jgi:hypothetical protein
MSKAVKSICMFNADWMKEGECMALKPCRWCNQMPVITYDKKRTLFAARCPNCGAKVFDAAESFVEERWNLMNMRSNEVVNEVNRAKREGYIALEA